jgi:TolB-like protein
MEPINMKSITKNSVNNRCIFRSAFASLLLISLLQGCALMGSGSTDADRVASTENLSDTNTVSDEAKSPELAQAENQVRALEQQLESLKIEWEQQKPALERLVSNEADLEFLVQALADMSQLADEPSRSQYLGQDELTAEKREQSLQALQSLVSTQEELNTLLVELSTVVSDVAANSQNTGAQTAQNSTAMAEASEVAAQVEPQAEQQTAVSGASVVDLSTQQAGQNQGQIEVQYSSTGQTSSLEVAADCNCSDSASSSPATMEPARAKDPSWFAMTTPYTEAAPAGSNGQISQLDSGAAAGAPIPGLEVKTFKRRTLPSELAAVGAPVQHYAMAPQFHMSRKSLSDYVSQLAFKLAGNQQLAGNKIGVASFVFFDEQLEQTSSVGNQLAEELSTVLPNYGAKVIEYKLTRQITVSPTGDLSLSRNTRKLRDSQGMDYVLTGTMVPTRRGLQINSRVVSTRDNVVIASATTLIPAMVLQQL